MQPQTHHAVLETINTIAAGRQIKAEPIGLQQKLPYNLHLVQQFLIQRYKAENVQVVALLDCDQRNPRIECTWTYKPRIGSKNRAYLAAHGIQV